MFMLGATGESPESDPTPAIARFVNVEPSALLNAPPWLALLMTLATTSSAVISPFRMFTLAALAVLCAPVSAVPISPDVRSEEHTSELQSHSDLVCRLLREKKTLISLRQTVDGPNGQSL